MKTRSLFLVFFLVANRCLAQSFAINTTGASADTSSLLDINSSSKGVLFPRMTKAQKNAIALPAPGLLVYQTTPDSLGFHLTAVLPYKAMALLGIG